jgi:long-chain acyl-CoA synthetase
VGEVRLTRRALPRTRLGKLRRHLLAGRLEEARKAGARKQKPLDPEDMADEDRRLLEDKAARDAWEWLAERFADRPLTPDSNPELDLDIDSLEWVGLSLELERRTGVRLSEEEIARVETVRDLLRLAAGGGSGRRGPSLQDALERPRDALSPEQRVWLDHWPAGREKQLLALLWLDRLLVRLLARVRVFGLERLQAGEPLVLCPNHASFLDPFLLASVLGRQRLARTRWVGLADFLRLTPLHRHISRVAGALPLDPRTSPVSGLALAAAALDQGQSLVWFPEGRRSPHGRVQEFLPGVGELLAARHIRAVPVRITGSFQILPAGRLLPRPGGVAVAFGGPLTADELERRADAGRDEARDRPRRIARGLRRAVESLGAQ